MKKLFLLITLVTLNVAFAEDKADATNHEAHHPKTEVKAEEKKMDMGNGMMDSTHMTEMMGQCMEKNKDNKMCSHEMMAQCQEKMGKKECAKMMKKMKGHKMNMDMDKKGMEGHDMDKMKQ